MGEIISGKLIAESIKKEIADFVEQRKSNDFKIPKIASILVGDDGGSIYYINSQEKVARSLGVDFEKILFNDSILEDKLIEEIVKLNNRSDIPGG